MVFNPYPINNVKCLDLSSLWRLTSSMTEVVTGILLFLASLPIPTGFLAPQITREAAEGYGRHDHAANGAIGSWTGAEQPYPTTRSCPFWRLNAHDVLCEAIHICLMSGFPQI